jgi:radical SAM superfamily enzyme YgiQ (UPF0313 family)
MADIVLSTLNARYVHASLGLRYLLANLGELEARAKIMEFVLGTRPLDLVEALLQEQPRIIGFGVYIWNVEETTRVIALLKRVAPQVIVVTGGPEVSYELEDRRIVGLADYVVTGPGDVSFAKLCDRLLGGGRPLQNVIAGEQVALDGLRLPYRLYNEEDIAQRFLYVEASRGCPFRCEFCLSSLDKTAWPFKLERFLAELDQLHRRGARHFRFVDRTFNLNIRTGLAILRFFLERLDERLFIHFEVVPEHLPDRLKETIGRFPEGSLQFEVGIQTWNAEVQTLISRKQDNARAEQNLAWLREHSRAFIHVDLIAGLPGEDLAGFGAGFDRLHALGPHEIQVGILKRLRGTPIARHTERYGLCFNPDPPYNILATDRIDFTNMQRITRFARYWDLVGNSGRFRRTLPLLLGEAPFRRFMAFSDWLFARTRKTHEFALERLYESVHAYLLECGDADNETAARALAEDYQSSGAKGAPSFMVQPPPGATRHARSLSPDRPGLRQVRHMG